MSWCNGDIKQIETIVRSLPEYTANKRTANKHNPARSGVDQPCDVTDKFKIIKRMQAEYTVKDTPPDQHPMKQLVNTMFTKLSKDGKISLKTSKKNALVDFLSCVPEIVTSAAKRDFIIKGFLTPGLITPSISVIPTLTPFYPPAAAIRPNGNIVSATPPSSPY